MTTETHATDPLSFAVADKWTARRLGSIPCAIAFGAADVGTCNVGGEPVYITWGRNLNPGQADWFAERTRFRPVMTDGGIELILPASIHQELRWIERAESEAKP